MMLEFVWIGGCVIAVTAALVGFMPWWAAWATGTTLSFFAEVGRWNEGGREVYVENMHRNDLPAPPEKFKWFSRILMALAWPVAVPLATVAIVLVLKEQGGSDE